MKDFGHSPRALTRYRRDNGARCHWQIVGLSMIIIPLVLAGCASPVVEPERTAPILVAEDLTPKPVEGERLDLNTIERVTSIARTDSLLRARYERNQLLLAELDASTLMAIDSRLAWYSGDLLAARGLLDQLLTDNSAARDFVWRDLEDYATLEGDWLAAARQLFLRVQRDTKTAQDGTDSDRLFGYLLRLDTEVIGEELRDTKDAEWGRWLQMVIAYQEGIAAFSSWRNQINAAPTSPAVPAHLSRWTGSNDIGQISLLLPLEGNLAPAGQAVLLGAIEKLYTLYPDPGQRPALVTTDSSRASDIQEAYRQATQNGADLIIGPLTKANVASLRQLNHRSVPVIALNDVDEKTQRDQTDWTSLSLQPEDEARQIADIAFGRACRHAIVVATDKGRGTRLLSAFTARWTELGGKTRGQLLIDDPAKTNEAMGVLLGSGSSDSRIRTVERAFDLPVDARGRGRSDFECIFMLAPDPATARTWRPLLVFHMTGDIPVYATSAINDGLIDTRNRDLNGVLFVETPAMLPPNTTDRLSRLRALGKDALTLAQHWRQASTTDSWIIRGETGLLRRKTNGSIERALNLATFDGPQVRREDVR